MKKIKKEEKKAKKANKKSKGFLTFFFLVISAASIWLFVGSYSPIDSVRQAKNAPKELVSLRKEAPEIAERMHITAHRGVNALAPENTLPAYEKAIKLGYYSAECDIKQSSDGTWVLYHDPTLLSRFGVWGAVGDKDLATLQSYRYRTGAAYWEYPELRIPTLAEFLDLFVGSITRPQIEIKTKNFDSLQSVVDAIKARSLEKSAIIISFDEKQLQEIRKYDSDIELWFLCYRIDQKKIDTAKSLGNCWLSADASLNSEKTIGQCLEQNVGLSLWTVNTVEKAKALESMGVRYIETDLLY